MSEEIFRKKSLDRVKSPETLDDYIRVSNPGIWLLLISVILLLVGACVWGVLGRVDSTVPCTVSIEDGSGVCYIAEEDIASVQTGQKVSFVKGEALLSRMGEKGELGYTWELEVNSALADGVYEGKVIIKSYSPLSFILN